MSAAARIVASELAHIEAQRALDRARRAWLAANVARSSLDRVAGDHRVEAYVAHSEAQRLARVEARRAADASLAAQRAASEMAVAYEELAWATDRDSGCYAVAKEMRS